MADRAFRVGDLAVSEAEAFGLVGIIFAPWLLIELVEWAVDKIRMRPRLVRYEPDRPLSLAELILEDAKRMQPIDTGWLRASVGDPDTRTCDLAPDTDTGLDHSGAPVGYILAYEVDAAESAGQLQLPGALSGL